MVGLFVILLTVFLLAFFGGMDQLHELLGGQINIMGTTTGSPEFQVFLGGAIAFLEFVIILFSMLDRIIDTLRETVKPLARLVPLGAFITVIYQTFAPIFQDFASRGMGAAGTDSTYIAQAVSNGTLSQGILLTLGTMLLFLLANRIFGGESDEVRALKAELAKYRKVRKLL